MAREIVFSRKNPRYDWDRLTTFMGIPPNFFWPRVAKSGHSGQIRGQNLKLWVVSDHKSKTFLAIMDFSGHDMAKEMSSFFDILQCERLLLRSVFFTYP